ncbi:hypothetical protein GCM10017687_45850 [Streptomyces echinatus]
MESTAGAGQLLAISDLHISYPENRALVEDMRPESDDDWLIVAGDVAETVADVRWALGTLASRFRKVLWAPGNHELWTHPSDPVTLRGVARYEHLVEMCRELGVVTPEDPYPVWRGAGGPAVVAPLFLLYDYSFLPAGCATKAEGLAYAHGTGVVCNDEFLLHPDPYPTREDWCRARVAETERRLAELPEDLPTVLAGQLPAGPAPHGDPLVPRVRHVVRHRADRRLAPPVPGRHHGLRSSPHPPYHLARRSPLHGGLRGISPRVGQAPGSPGKAAPRSADGGRSR